MDFFAVRAAYSSVELFAQLVNESLTNQLHQSSQNGTLDLKESDFCGGRQLVSLARNRLIPLTVEDVYVDNGSQESDLEVFMLSASRSKMEVIMKR